MQAKFLFLILGISSNSTVLCVTPSILCTTKKRNNTYGIQKLQKSHNKCGHCLIRAGGQGFGCLVSPGNPKQGLKWGV